MPSLLSNSSPISSINRTQNTTSSSIFSTQSHVLSSISHAASGAESSPASSIYRVGNLRIPASTSITHPGVPAMDMADANSDEARDRLRYRYIQKRMKEKRLEAAMQSDIPGSAVGTGGAFSRKKFHKGLIKMKYGRPDKYKNLSISDLKYFENLVGSHAKSLKTGGGFSKNTKLRMKRQLWKDSRAGTVSSRSDRKDMESLINNLPSAGY